MLAGLSQEKNKNHERFFFSMEGIRNMPNNNRIHFIGRVNDHCHHDRKDHKEIWKIDTLLLSLPSHYIWTLHIGYVVLIRNADGTIRTSSSSRTGTLVYRKRYYLQDQRFLRKLWRWVCAFLHLRSLLLLLLQDSQEYE